jgi:hypothetical protein
VASGDAGSSGACEKRKNKYFVKISKKARQMNFFDV